MKVYKITARRWLTQKSNGYSSFMLKYNNNNPMPLMTMCGYYTKESPRMKYWHLHGDIFAERTAYCMKCGRLLTNPVSEYFGVGPECGGHNYVNPFNSAEELEYAVNTYKKQLQNTTWEGWIPDDDILSIEEIGENDIQAEPSVTTKEIKVKIGKSKTIVSEQSAFLSFYYDETVLNLVRSLPIRRWHNEEKLWEIPATEFENLKKQLPDYTFKVEGKIKKQISNLPDNFKFKTEPFEHQTESFIYALNHDRWLLGDEQGLGKTKQVIDIAVAKKLTRGYKHCLVVCGVNGLKWNWVNEIKTHSDEGAYILGQTVRKGKVTVGGTTAKIQDLAHLDKINEYFIIINVESLRNKNIVDYIVSYCKDRTIGIVAIDEIHKCFDYDTMITTDWGKLSIGSIVTNKLPVNVLSYNEATNTVELKPVVNWFENTIAEKMIELTIEADNGEIKTIKCTPNHRFYTKNRGWVEAQDLTEDDDLTDCT